MRPWFIAAGLMACGADDATCDTEARMPASGAGGNLLVIVLDDVGVDKIAGYRVHPTPPSTPSLDRLIDSGVRFDRAYASPGCSATRASILTGRHPSRHGIGTWLNPARDRWSLPDEEHTIAEVARDAGWSTAAIGKWHVSAFLDHRPELDPQRQGFDRFHGVLANLYNSVGETDRPRGYTWWERVDDGVFSWTDTYATTAQTDDALAAIDAMPEPWLAYVAYSAAHEPLEAPPEALAVPTSDAEVDLYDAVVHALDAEIGRLVAGLGPERLATTTIVLIGDNGTPKEAIRPPFSSEAGKGTLTEGGIRVPLVVAGPLVAAPGTTSDALVHAADVFATLVDLTGTAELPAPIDGVSLLPHVVDPTGATRRRCTLVEQFAPDGDVRRKTLGRAVIGPVHKIVDRRHAPPEHTTVGSHPALEAVAYDAEAFHVLLDELRRYDRALR